jgi:hypothetical protein
LKLQQLKSPGIVRGFFVPWLISLADDGPGSALRRPPSTCPECASASVWPALRAARSQRERGKLMRKLLLIAGFLALAVGLLWIGQGTGTINWPQSSFMIRQIQWAGYGALLGAFGLILIWQSKR